MIGQSGVEENTAVIDWDDVQRLFTGRRFQLALESIDSAVYLLDPEGVVRGWTRGAERVLGYPSSEVMGRHFSMFYPANEADSGHPTRELALAAERERHEDAGWRIRKDGSRFWASVTISAVRNDAGDL